MKDFFALAIDVCQYILCLNIIELVLFSFLGITSKMDNFKNLQMDSIWISPFFESPKIDMGYDIYNYTDVDPIFGTLVDFKELSKEAEKRGEYVGSFVNFLET